MPDKRDGITVGHRFYDPATSARAVQELRAKDKEIHESNVDFYANLEEYSSIPISYAIPAIRGWQINNNGMLRSVATEYEWDAPVKRNDRAPRKSGGTGYWAVKPSGFHILEAYDPCVIGFVELEGRVIEHELGWRGEICVIRELFIDKINTNRLLGVHDLGLSVARALIPRLEQLYQCDVSLVESYAEVKRRFK